MKNIRHHVRYHIDEGKREITATILGTRDDFINFLKELDFWGIFSFTVSQCKKLEMPSAFVGKSRCDVNDTWDVELGKKIAYDRAKKNRDRSFFKRANTYANFVATKQDQVFNLIDGYGEKLSINQDYRAKKIGEQIQE